ncbi:hypothetical protein L1049_003412 [Liquidambar formosana]|uniref:FCP1 homology domain-containing protein n=1 Tax=Liquidambar formosana TaxID=63359 RepID=A0AAP0N5P9_LIQFO
MPAFKMKAKSVTCCVREGTCLHVCRKSSKISKNSCSQVWSSCETTELDRFFQNCQNGSTNIELSAQENGIDEAVGHTKLLDGETLMYQKGPLSVDDPVTYERMDFPPSTCPPDLETIFSPIIESDGVRCKPIAHDTAGSEDDLGVLQVTADNNDNWSSDLSICQNCNASDFYIADMSISGFPIDGINGFDNNLNSKLFPDYECVEPNMMFDVAERCMMLPSLEETVETINTRYAGSCEEVLMNSDDSWFHLVTHQIKPGNQELDVNPTHLDSDEADSFDPHLFIRNFPDLSDVGPNLLPALFPKETSKRKGITLVLDLDETLVHSTLESCDNADFTFPVFFNTKEHTVYVRQRPFLQTFLDRVAEMFEVVVFTASQSIYAEQLLDILDPERKLISRRAYRESCIFSDGSYTKDLTVLGVDLAKVAIIDNSPQVFRLQVDNGIPIKSWFDDPSDRALISLLPFLETLVDADDVRPIIAKKFGVKE